jgi:hypothetical protein
MNGILRRTEVKFAGWHIHLENLREKEELQTSRSTTEAIKHRLYVLKSDGLGIEGMAGSGLTVNYSSDVTLGSRWVIIGVAQQDESAPLRLVRNPVNQTTNISK